METKNENENENENKYFVYLLVSFDKKATYVGASVDIHHRLRQHNGELVGGAHATRAKLHIGPWHHAVYISGFPTWQAALQFEWRWKQLTRKTTKDLKKCSPLKRRLYSLHQLLSLEQSTSKAIPYAQWPTPPVINYLDDVSENIYKQEIIMDLI